MMTGSQFNDFMNGGPGNDQLYGAAGRDILTGGRDADRMEGGSGNDTFAFYAGDIAKPGTSGTYDEIVDFHGAGTSGGETEQDFICFTAFGGGARLTFEAYASADHRSQLYAILDPANAANDGTISVHMSDGASQLACSDFAFL